MGFPALEASPREYAGGRACPPEATVERIRSSLERAGIRCQFEDRTAAGRFPRSLGLFEGGIRLHNGSMSSCGKGTSPALCMASAYAEFVERLTTGSFRQIVPLLRHHELSRRGIHFRRAAEIPDWPESYFLEGWLRPPSARTRYRMRQVYQPWRPIYSLTQKRSIEYPFLWHGIVHATSGLAAGNTLAEALMHGACEALEREARVRALGGAPLDRVDARTLPPPAREWRRVLSRAGVESTVFDLSLAGVPAFGVLFEEREPRSNNVLAAAWSRRRLIVGCSMSPAVALERCFTEYFQVASQTPSYVAQPGTGRRQLADFLGWDDAIDIPFLSNAATHNRQPLPSGTMRSFRDVENIGAADARDELAELVARLERARIEVLAEDLTNPVLGFPVVRVVLPGCRAAFVESADQILGCLDAVERCSRGEFASYGGLTTPFANTYYGHAMIYSTMIAEEWKREPAILARLIQAVQVSIKHETIAGHRGATLFGLRNALMTLVQLYVVAGSWDKARFIAGLLVRETSRANTIFWGLHRYLQDNRKPEGAPRGGRESTGTVQTTASEIQRNLEGMREEIHLVRSCGFACRQCATGFPCPFQDPAVRALFGG